MITAKAKEKMGSEVRTTLRVGDNDFSQTERMYLEINFFDPNLNRICTWTIIKRSRQF